MGVNSALQFKATREDISKTIEVKGKSSYVNEKLIYPPYDGNVRKWNITDGQQVNEGDVLFEMEEGSLAIDIEQQEAALRKQELESKLKKIQDQLSLGPDSLAGKAEGIAAQSAVPGSEALKRYGHEESLKVQEELDGLNRKAVLTQLDEKKGKLNKAKLAAPAGGIFIFSDKKEPPKVEEKTLLGKIVDLSKLQLTTNVSEYEVYQMKPGMAVEIKVDALPQLKLQGKIDRISKFAKAGTDQGTTAAQFEVVISLDTNDQLIAGLSLTGTISVDKKQGALVIPTIAVQREKEQYFVYIQGAQGPEKKTVTVGLETSDKTEITGGLSEGDTVILQ